MDGGVRGVEAERDDGGAGDGADDWRGEAGLGWACGGWNALHASETWWSVGADASGRWRWARRALLGASGIEAAVLLLEDVSGVEWREMDGAVSAMKTARASGEWRTPISEERGVAARRSTPSGSARRRGGEVR